MARVDFENLDEAINYIKENEKAIDNYKDLNTTFENYKSNTDTKISELEKTNSDLQSANMTLYLQTCQGQDNKENDNKSNETERVTLDKLIDKI